MFKLIIQDDEGKTTVVPLIRDEITIGRKEGNTIRLTERNVSRRHARILRSNGSVLIEDLDSYNGIKVNGSRVSGRVKVAESDRIQIGDYLLELKFDRVAQAGEDIQATQPMEKVDTAILTATLPIGQQPTMQLPLPPMAAEPTAIVASGSAAPLADDGARSSRPPRVTGDATIPDVAATDVVEAGSDEPAKLVVISANMAGKEFVLDGAAMVIGRTDENDVVINHRSISRHHAKIVKEHGRYAIVDLQSSNGVRVNGEEYGKVELRRGDLIDLGHVRFRFVEPGEDFVYERDAALIKGAHRGGSRAKVYLLLGLAAAGAATAVFLLKKDSTTQPSVTSVADASKVVLAPVADAAAMIATPTPDAAPADPMAAALAEAEAAVKREDWTAAVKAAQSVINKQPRHAKYAEAVVLRDHANRELQSKKIFDDFQKAAASGDFGGMERQLKRLPEGSVYVTQARAAWDEKARANGEKVLAGAEKLRTEGKCTELKAQIRREGGRILDEQKQALDDAASRCVAKVVPNNNTSNNNNNSNNTNNTPPNNAAAQQEAYDAAMTAGRDAIVAQSYSKALQKFEEALDAKPGDQEAAMLAGISACNLKNAEVAGKYIRRLKVAAKQSMVRQLCFKQNITPKE